MNEKEIIEYIEMVEIKKPYLERTIKSYILRNNNLNDAQRRIVMEAYPKYGVPFKEEQIDPKTLFNNDNPVVIEIGFGMGTSTIEIAEKRPDLNFLALEVYLPGITNLLNLANQSGVENLKVLRFNAVEVLESMIKDESVAGFHIFFPDPWPKKKHFKRRIIQEPFVRLLSQKLEKGGYIYAVTDWVPYAEWMVEELNKVETIKNKYELYSPKVSWRPLTKFEKKGLDKDYIINELWYEKY